jgi:uncharacterized membrane protein
MATWVAWLATQVALVIQLIAVVFIAAGTLEAVATVFKGLVMRADIDRYRQIWIRYARVLIGGLTFMLAADVVDTAIAPDWDDIGKLAAIAAIRTALNYFLERDMREMGLRAQEESARRARAEP